MRFTLLLLVALAALVSCSPIDYERRLVNRPSNDRIFRSLQSPQYGVKDVPRKRPSSHRLEYNVRKGEYVCGNRICKLRPGEEPPGCQGICQYPVLPD